MSVPKYNGRFGAKQAERLLWRAGFGPRQGEAKKLARMGMRRAVRSLTRPKGKPRRSGATGSRGQSSAPAEPLSNSSTAARTFMTFGYAVSAAHDGSARPRSRQATPRRCERNCERAATRFGARFPATERSGWRLGSKSASAARRPVGPHQPHRVGLAGDRLARLLCPRGALDIDMGEPALRPARQPPAPAAGEHQKGRGE